MVQLTLRLRLQGTLEALRVLRETAVVYTESFNRVCQLGYGMPRVNGVELHHLTYRDEMTATKLPSQLVCSARTKATEALASVRVGARKGKTVSCPQSLHASIRYDARSALIRLRDGYATFASLHGRQRFTFQVPSYAQNRLDLKVCSSEVVEHRNGKLYLHVVLDHPTPEFQDSGAVVGVDLGVNQPAVTSTALFLGSRHWKEVQRRTFRLRRQLQSKGTRSARRHLRRLCQRENRFRLDCDHVLSKRLVQRVPPGTTLVLEDLTDIRERVQSRKKQRRRLHSWSFHRLQAFLGYKASLSGVRVVYADPRYTSQKCSQCGHTAKANRPSQATFHCQDCHFQLHADLNAARNLHHNYLASLGTPLRSGLPVTQPIVPTATTVKLRTQRPRSG